MSHPASAQLEIMPPGLAVPPGRRVHFGQAGHCEDHLLWWYDRFLAFGDAGLDDRISSPGRVWNRIPDDVRGQIIDLALEETQLSPRELADQVYGHQGLLCLGSLGLPASQGPRPDH